jgi:hypothetical protein
LLDLPPHLLGGAPTIGQAAQRPPPPQKKNATCPSRAPGAHGIHTPTICWCNLQPAICNFNRLKCGPCRWGVDTPLEALKKNAATPPHCIEHQTQTCWRVTYTHLVPSTALRSAAMGAPSALRRCGPPTACALGKREADECPPSPMTPNSLVGLSIRTTVPAPQHVGLFGKRPPTPSPCYRGGIRPQHFGAKRSRSLLYQPDSGRGSLGDGS